jgi:hypothetical protein
VSSFRLVAIVEGPSDRRCIAFLLEAWRRHRGAELDWTDETTFELIGLHDAEDYLDLHKVPERARERRIPRLRGGEEGLLRQALEVALEVGNRSGQGQALLNLATVHHRLNRVDCTASGERARWRWRTSSERAGWRRQTGTRTPRPWP